MSDREDPLEDQLRAALRGSEPQPDVDAFLDQVHRGARRRHTRRIVAGTAAAVCLVAVGGVAVNATGVFDDSRTQAADQTVRTTPGSAPAASLASNEAAPQSPSSELSPLSDAAAGVDPADIVPLDVTASDPDQQWLLGSVPGGDCGAKRCPRVFATQDAGGSWSDLGELPAHLVRGTEDPESVDGLRLASDGDNGWAFRGALLATHDGGQSWIPQEVPVPGNVIRVESSGEDALAIVYDGESASLLHSEVGSDTWDMVPYDEQAGIDDPLAAVGDVAMSEDAALMTVYRPDGGTVLVSEDGGRNWEQPGSEGYCELSTESASLVSATGESLWVSCVDRQGRTTVAASTDGGASWQPAAGSFGNGASIAGRAADEAVVVEGAGRYGVEGAEVWRTGLKPEGQAERVDTVGGGTPTFVEFADPDVGFIVFDQGGVQRTTDGGLTWEPFGVTDLD